MEQRFKTKQCTGIGMLSGKDLERIGELIYDTDPYIYPAIFETQEKARRIIPLLIESRKDNMFCYENLYLIYKDSEIVGVILWHKGPLEYKSECLFDMAVQYGIKQDNVKVTVEQYFDSYKNQEQEVISVINVCIHKQYRHQGIGSYILREFIKEHYNEKLELYTLADNKCAVNLYSKYDFQIIKEQKGFSLDENKPYCFQMVRYL